MLIVIREVHRYVHPAWFSREGDVFWRRTVVLIVTKNIPIIFRYKLREHLIVRLVILTLVCLTNELDVDKYVDTDNGGNNSQ